MDGAKLAISLRALPAARDLPLVLLSSLGERPLQASPADFADILTKPVRSSQLRDTLAHALHVRPTDPITPLQRSRKPAPVMLPLRILLAEDNPTNQLVGRLMLTKLGHRVDVVGNGVEAVAAVTRAFYDVVLMDVQMPEMDGLQATRRIRAELPSHRQPHIVALTAGVTAEGRRACTSAGMNAYVAKTVRASDLGAALRAVDPRQARRVSSPVAG